MANIGYARARSVGKNLEVQIAKLSGCDKIYREKSGIDGSRPQLKACLDRVRKGDTLVVTSLDRIARSTPHLHRIYEQIRRKGATLNVIDQQINTNSENGRRIFRMLALVVELEKKLRAERQADGIAKAKEMGVKFGRKALLSDEQAAELRKRRAEGVLIKTLMAEYGLSKASVYRYLALKERGISHARRLKLTPSQVVEMRKRRKKGALIESLAQDYGISTQLVRKYLRLMLPAA